MDETIASVHNSSLLVVAHLSIPGEHYGQISILCVLETLCAMWEQILSDGVVAASMGTLQDSGSSL